jgi:hypothetical protein
MMRERRWWSFAWSPSTVDTTKWGGGKITDARSDGVPTVSDNPPSHAMKICPLPRLVAPLAPCGRAVTGALAAVVVALGGCATQHVLTVTGGELHRNLGELRAEGKATVDAVDHVEGQDEADQARTRREVVRFDQVIYFEGKRFAIAALAQGCGDVAPFADDAISQRDCRLVRMRQSELGIREFRTRSYDGLLTAGIVLGLGGLGGLALDTAVPSDSGWETAGHYTVGAIGGILVGGLLWMIVDCRGRWGSPGCRD